MKKQKKLNKAKIRRARRVRSRLRGVAQKPRLTVRRSNRYIYVQLIDDEKRKTIASASSRSLAAKIKKQEAAGKVGELIAEAAKKLGVTQAVLDRGSYRYHGRLKALAEGARKAGLKL